MLIVVGRRKRKLRKLRYFYRNFISLAQNIGVFVSERHHLIYRELLACSLSLSLCLSSGYISSLFSHHFFSPMVRLFSVMWLQYRKFWSGNNQNYLHWLQTILVIRLQSYLVHTYYKGMWAFALLACGGCG